MLFTRGEIYLDAKSNDTLPSQGPASWQCLRTDQQDLNGMQAFSLKNNQHCKNKVQNLIFLHMTDTILKVRYSYEIFENKTSWSHMQW